MKIPLIHQHFYPEPSGTAKSAYEIVRYFSAKGYDVNVVTEFPNHSFKFFIEKEEKMGVNAIELISRNYSWGNIANQLLIHYQNILNNKEKN